MIKTVIFDVDNTLYDFDRAHARAYAALAEYAEAELGLSGEVFVRKLKETGAGLQKYMGDVAAVHNRTIRYQNMLEDNGFPLHPHVLRMDGLYWDTLIREAVPSPGASEALRGLKGMGLRIGIGTDMTARMQFRKLTALGLMPYIDFLVSSEEAGAEKPSARFFSRCVTKAGCAASECLFVGDSLKKDVLGAMDAGLKAVWYCPGEECPEVGVPRTENLERLPRMTAKWQ